MTFADDTTLTRAGLPPQGRGRVLVLACGALAREIKALTRLNGWDHIDLACLPAILHNRPERIAPALRKAILRHRPNYDTILIGYGDCGTGGAIDALCAEFGIERLPGPHCYAFFSGTAAFEADGEVTSFFLTDFLARQFDAFVTEPLGLDRHPELRDAYFGNYETLVYLAQTDDDALTARAEAAARSLGLAFERRFTGYGDLADALASA
ncbi:Protein of unknown function [Palleronia marisminoris]|uniref:DUF1638 domain-containing protein n=1 Tax=Palleronia marisminoris TaxID=315423 RepID=A0A1Y5T991_9RHOB|nr:DUF1638 domain-containing protein [Palleronia marisminoris]SFH23839.1 Protein of unknown function [Palleronia marisminoris]SLN58563.1 hypothetical protein PAM7066_02865 [Palleronia marisminoris]